MNLPELNEADIAALKWYYKVELKPGMYTGGRLRGTSSMTRAIVRNIELRDQKCIDIGTQEALLPVLMHRQGAKLVSAYDRLNLSDRLALVQQAYNVDINYYHSLQLSELPEVVWNKEEAPYDVVVFAGVLYHMIDPLSGLATVRSLVREGGLVVVETSVAATREHIAYINAEGRFYNGSNYFQVSIGTLDYFLKMLRLKPIDLLFTEPSEAGISRATIVAQAVDSVVSVNDDSWIKGNWIREDMKSAHLYYDRLVSSAPKVQYTPINKENCFYSGTDILDVCTTFEKSQPHRSTKQEAMLSLGDFE